MKYSRQRELIYNAVMEEHVHPTAEDVYKKLKLDNPQLSLGTVYRNLQVLSEIGSLKKLTFPDKPDKYDGNKKQHYHGICVNCGDIKDIYIGYKEDIDKQVNDETGYVVLSHDVVFNVICPKCENRIQ